MAHRMDLNGHRYGSLTVLDPAPSRRNTSRIITYWNCVCDCGTVSEVSTSNLREGKVLTCGCSRRLLPKEWSQSPEYFAWWNMRSRCDDPLNKDYKNYGARGITYCEEWCDFLRFADDMGHKPSIELTLERIDNNGPYCKENCVWTTRSVQNNNSRNTRLFRPSSNGDLK